MRTVFENVVLEIIFVEQHQAALVADVRELLSAATNTTD